MTTAVNSRMSCLVLIYARTGCYNFTHFDFAPNHVDAALVRGVQLGHSSAEGTFQQDAGQGGSRMVVVLPLEPIRCARHSFSTTMPHSAHQVTVIMIFGALRISSKRFALYFFILLE